MPSIQDCIRQMCEFPRAYINDDITPIALIGAISYETYHNKITVEMIAEHIQRNPELVELWLRFTEDKRWTPAWGLNAVGKCYNLSYFQHTGRPAFGALFADKYLATATMVCFEMESLLVNSKKNSPNKAL